MQDYRNGLWFSILDLYGQVVSPPCTQNTFKSPKVKFTLSATPFKLIRNWLSGSHMSIILCQCLGHICPSSYANVWVRYVHHPMPMSESNMSTILCQCLGHICPPSYANVWVTYVHHPMPMSESHMSTILCQCLSHICPLSYANVWVTYVHHPMPM